MTPQYEAFLVISATATGTAVWLAVREREHRPVAAMLAFGLGCDVLQEVVRPVYLEQPRPFSGAARVAWHGGQAAFAAYPWAVAAVALLVLAKRPRWSCVVGAGWLAYEALLVTGYRALELRGSRLGLVYLAAQALLVTGMGATVVPWWRQWWARWTADQVVPSLTEALVALAAGIELVILAGPLLLGRPWDNARWITLARPAYATYYVIAILVQGVRLWSR